MLAVMCLQGPKARRRSMGFACRKVLEGIVLRRLLAGDKMALTKLGKAALSHRNPMAKVGSKQAKAYQIET